MFKIESKFRKIKKKKKIEKKFFDSETISSQNIALKSLYEEHIILVIGSQWFTKES